jgi:hypothetical protein
MKKRSVTLILFCLLLVNACGKLKLEGDDIYADFLVTKADAEKIFGEPMQLKALEKHGERNFCSYTNVGGSQSKNLQASFQTAPDVETLIAAVEMAKEHAAQTGAKIETINGIGDAAWLKIDEYEQRLFVRKNKVGFIITFSGDMSNVSGIDGIKNLSREITEML